MPTLPKTKKSTKTSQIGTLKPVLAPKQRTEASKPPKTEPVMGSKAFKKLQKQWYKKLKQADPEYKDIEAGLEHGRLNGQSSSDARAHERYVYNSGPTQHYYSRWTCYLAHHDNGQLTYLEKTVLELTGQGCGIDDIHPYVKKYVNKFQLYYLIERLKAHVEVWNRTNPDGMDFISDFEISRPLKK